MTLCYRWLGTAGLEFATGGYTLLVDPFFTRPGKLALLSGRRVQSDAGLVAQHIQRADAVLVTHAHYDHLLDVPEVLRQTGARAYGSPNTCAVLAMHAIPDEKVTCVHPGDQLSLGPFEVEVMPAVHTPIPFQRLFNGPLAERMRLRPRLPLRLIDYRMDVSYSFRIHAAGQVILVGNHAAPADVLFISPFRSGGSTPEVYRAIHPRMVVLIHWDDFMRPLSSPLVATLVFPFHGPRAGRRIVGRLDLQAYSEQVAEVLPEARVVIPRLLRTERLEPD